MQYAFNKRGADYQELTPKGKILVRGSVLEGWAK